MLPIAFKNVNLLLNNDIGQFHESNQVWLARIAAKRISPEDHHRNFMNHSPGGTQKIYTTAVRG